MPRKVGYKHLQKTRDKIKATQIVNRMMKHVEADKDVMSQSQVNAAKALLNKVLPDLRSTELTGADGDALFPTSVTVNVVSPKKDT